MALVKPSTRSTAPLLALFVLLLCSAGAAIFLAAEQRAAGVWIRHTFDVQSDLHNVLNLVTDAETGQRGYLLTGRPVYLDPYVAARRALPGASAKLSADTADDPLQRPLDANLQAQVRDKLAELQRTIDLRRSGQLAPALAIVNNDSGQHAMAAIRDTIKRMQEEELDLLKRRATNYRLYNTVGQWVLLATPLLLLILGAFTVLDSRRRMQELRIANDLLEREASERERAEGQLRQLQKMEAVGQLTGGIAHDFNNMLAIILGCLDMARRRLSPASDQRALHYIENAADGASRAAVLTARLLAFSRQQPLDPTVMDPNRLVSGMSDMLHRTLGEAISIETVLGARLWKVRADASQIENALLNLAVNARDALPDGGRLTIETANCELDEQYAATQSELVPGQYVMLSVTDNGDGMSPETVQRAFDPFFTTKAVGKGTGLGLSQVFGFVKQSGGHVAIYSEIGAGTTVKIYLPRFAGAGGAIDEPEERQSATALVPAGSPDEIILVVEDQDAVRKITVDALRDLGYTVVHADSGRQALRRLAEQPAVKLMLTDVVMPEMNGKQLADKALEANADLKVVFATGYTRNAIVHHGTVDTGTALLTKPFTIAQLANKVRQVLDA